MSICLLVMTDGRDTIHPTLRSAADMLAGPITRRVIHDDSGDGHHRAALAARYPAFEVIGGKRVGFGAAIARAWQTVSQLEGVRWVFHLEDDFVIERPVDLAAMVAVMTERPHIQQMALRRQPWNEGEVAAGGIVEQHPADYSDRSDGPDCWLEHRRFFTTNPSLYRSELCRRGWPTGAQSEGRFGLDLFADPSATCGFWGDRMSPPWVTHIGIRRAGMGY